MRKSLFLIAGAVVVTASISVIGAQHLERGASAGPGHEAQFIHSFCSQDTPGHAGAGARTHVPAHLATALALTDAQQADLNRMGVDACTEIARIHERMMAVLTEEQRAKMHALHSGGGHHAAIVSWLKNLHRN